MTYTAYKYLSFKDVRRASYEGYAHFLGFLENNFPAEQEKILTILDKFFSEDFCKKFVTVEYNLPGFDFNKININFTWYSKSLFSLVILLLPHNNVTLNVKNDKGNLVPVNDVKERIVKFLSFLD